MEKQIYACFIKPSEKDQGMIDNYLINGLQPGNIYIVNDFNKRLNSSEVELRVPQFDGTTKNVLVEKSSCDFYRQYGDFDLIAFDVNKVSKPETVQMGM